MEGSAETLGSTVRQTVWWRGQWSGSPRSLGETVPAWRAPAGKTQSGRQRRGRGCEYGRCCRRKLVRIDKISTYHTGPPPVTGSLIKRQAAINVCDIGEVEKLRLEGVILTFFLSVE